MAPLLPPSSEYRNSPCWPAVDELLRERLSVLHHLLGCEAVDPASAAKDFSHAVGGLLFDLCIISDRPATSGHPGPHRVRPVETTLRNLTHMKNAARKSISSGDKFVHLVRAHNKVKKCHLKEQRAHDVTKNEREFRKNPWEYAQKRLISAKSLAEPSFPASTAVEHFLSLLR